MEKPFGRGGRGAQLLAAFQSQAPARRPGQTQSKDATEESQSCKVDTPTSQQSTVLGRGTLLQSLIQGRGRAVTTPSVKPSVSTDSSRPFGRGRGLALNTLLSETKSKTESSSSSVTVIRSVSPTSGVSSPGTSSSPLSDVCTQLEELNVGKHRGTSGDPIDLEVNYIRLRNVANSKGIYEYHVDFEPVVDSRRMKFRLMADSKVKALTGNVKTFDGMKLYLPLKLHVSPAQVTVTLPTDNSSVTVIIRLVKKSEPVDCLHLYNLLFRKVMHILKMTQVGRNYFDPKSGIPVPQHRLEIWPGYVTAVQEYEDGVMLNCDSSFRVLRTVTAYDIMSDFSRQRGSNIQEHTLKALVGCVVLTRYNNKTYKIDDVSWDMSPSSSFTTRDGSSITFVNYYKKSYDIDIKDFHQPLLIWVWYCVSCD